MATTTRVRLADFLLNPEIDDSRLELMDGEVTEKPMPNVGHGRAQGRILTILDALGIAGVEGRSVIPEANASPVPDVFFYRDDAPADDGYLITPPHVAVEVLSPGQSLTFMRRKAALYFSFGVESVWVVDLERSEIFVLEGGVERVLRPGDRLTSAAVPGLNVDVVDALPRPR